MSSAPPPSGPGERRLAALQRARIAQSAQAVDLEGLAELAAALLDAPYAAVTFLDARRGGSGAIARSPGSGAIARPSGSDAVVRPSGSGAVSGRPVGGTVRGRALVDLAVAADDGVVDVPLTADGPLPSDPLADRHPLLRRVAAAALWAPDGQRIGAVEVGWKRDRALAGVEEATLRRVAEHASRVLALRADATDYRRFVDLGPDAILVLDLEGAVELANPAMARLVGVDGAADLVGTTFLDLVVASDRERVAGELVEVLLARRRSARLDLGLRRADATVLPCAVTVGTLSGGRRSLQLVIRDLTARLRAEEERAQLSEQLAQAQRLDLAGRLASGLAHDLNNLLTVMGVNLELVEEGLQQLDGHGGIAEIDEDLRQVGGAVARAEQLTAKLLEFAGQRPVGLEMIAPADVVTAVETLVRPTLGDGVSLAVEVEAGLPPVVADRVQLEHALVNLIINARDALAEAGTITVRAGRENPGDHGGAADAGRGPEGSRVPREVADEGGEPQRRQRVRIEVTDDGVGMDEATAARAFEPLFSTRKGEGGTGLGLATVQTFVQQVGGSVELRSWPGEGTTVALLLPIDVPTETSATAPNESRPRILLVDPSERTRRVIATMLRSPGHQVVEASSGEEASRVADEGPVDLVVTELSLPGRSGWGLVEQLRERSPDLPALVFAASESLPPSPRVRTLVKPFSNERLLSTVTELLTPEP